MVMVGTAPRAADTFRITETESMGPGVRRDDVELRLPGRGLAERGLRCGEAGDRHAVGRAGDVVEPDLVTEADRSGIAAMLAADADLERGARLAAALDADPDQFADAVAIDRNKRIDLQNAAL